MKIITKQYATALYEAAKDKKKSEVKSVIKNFAKLIVLNNDVSKLDKIINEFEKIWNREQGVVEVEVVSARELDKTVIKWLHDFIVSLSKAKQVEITPTVDENIIGGVIVKYGDKVLDGSLKTKLNELKSQMVK